MIPDNNAWGRIFVFFMTVMGAIVGGLLALAVSLMRLGNLRSSLIGGVLGVLLFLLFSPPYPIGKMSLAFYRNEFLVGLVLYFVLVPVGLTLVGLLASVVARKLPST
jgi:peptidoglycan/LPS O-acetylase OafA/YrhL